jgi:hypothetical protein
MGINTYIYSVIANAASRPNRWSASSIILANRKQCLYIVVQTSRERDHDFRELVISILARIDFKPREV